MTFDFAAVTAPFRMQPGLRRIAPGTPQLTPARVGSRSLREKLGVLIHHADQALLCEDGFDAGPALAALCSQAAAEHPHAFSARGDRWQASLLGWSVSQDGALEGAGPVEIGACLAALAAPWRLAGLVSLAFEQDFAIVDAATGHVAWMAVCLPSRWAPEEKAGRHFAEVHAPVADNAILLAASDGLVRLVTGAERWERFVWTITTDATLDEHPRRIVRKPWPADASPEALATQAHWRTEHQTFIPVAGQRQAVFTIHVECRPLLEAIDSAERARSLLAALSTMSPAVLHYRGLTDARDGLLVWLAARSA